MPSSTTKKQQIELRSYLLDAEESECGIELVFVDEAAMKKFRQRLYAVRARSPEYSHLTFSDHGAKLWIVKRSPSDAQS